MDVEALVFTYDIVHHEFTLLGLHDDSCLVRFKENKVAFMDLDQR